MLASIPANEMAETLRVLAGGNAGNAARHFTRRSHDLGDIAGAILWTSIADTIEHASFVMSTPVDELAAPPVPKRMKQLLEATAFDAAWFEDVAADVLLQEMLAEETVPSSDEVKQLPECPEPVAQEAVTPADGDQWTLPLAA